MEDIHRPGLGWGWAGVCSLYVLSIAQVKGAIVSYDKVVMKKHKRARLITKAHLKTLLVYWCIRYVDVFSVGDVG